MHYELLIPEAKPILSRRRDILATVLNAMPNKYESENNDRRHRITKKLDVTTFSKPLLFILI